MNDKLGISYTTRRVQIWSAGYDFHQHCVDHKFPRFVHRDGRVRAFEPMGQPIILDINPAYLHVILDYFSTKEPSGLIQKALEDSVFYAELTTFKLLGKLGAVELNRNEQRHGIMHYLGTSRHMDAWSNPHELGWVKVTAANNPTENMHRFDGIMENPLPISPNISELLVRKMDCIEQEQNPVPILVSRNGQERAYLQVELMEDAVNVSGYTICHALPPIRTSNMEMAGLGWRVQASKDGKHWRTLGEHRNVSADQLVHDFEIPPSNHLWRHFRITQLDSRSVMALSAFELYGTIFKLAC